jgi:Ca2+/Na+ antiporter
LLDSGADVKAKDKNGVTLLQIAQKNTNPEIIEALGEVPTESAAQPQKKRIIQRMVLFWIGIMMLPGMCVMSSVMVDLDIPWISALFLLSWIVGFIFLVIAFIPKRKPKKEKYEEVKTEFAVGDVLAMAIVYEGYVMEELDDLEIAQELLNNFSDAGIQEDVNLHPYTVIQMRRADELAYYQGSYKPEDELLQMLEKGFVELKNRLEAEGLGIDQAKTRIVTLKGKSRIVSNCWVAMQIVQS